MYTQKQWYANTHYVKQSTEDVYIDKIIIEIVDQ